MSAVVESPAGNPSTRPPALPSVCPLDCPDTCSLSVTVQDGQVTGVRGSHANPYTAGVICDKVGRFYPSFVHGPQRLRQPMVRTGPRGSGQFRPIGWDEAIDRVHQGLQAAIDALPESYRLAVLLSDVEGLSYKEIAEDLDIPIGTVMSRLHRGRKALQKQLHDFAIERGLADAVPEAP